MKKILFILLASFTILFINSCKQDGNWDDNDGGAYTFKVERDTDFVEKAVGETNDLKLNIKPAYRFDAVKMYIKYTGDKNGVLKLGDLILEQNKDYEVKNADNILKYTANEEGTHKLKIILTNDKKQSVTEEFELKYAVSDFKVDIVTGSTEYYQGQEILYTGKIVPNKNTDTKGYTIKFNSYDGIIKFGGNPIELGKEYSITDINNLNISLSSNKSGQQKLSYTIKNSTVSRDLEILQNYKARLFSISNLDLTPTNLNINSNITLKGILKAIPKLEGPVMYKTWITDTTNTTGVQSTNGSYEGLNSLDPAGNFTLTFKALAFGTYTLNFQAKDSFGNETEIKQFKVVVEAPVEILNPMIGNVKILYKVGKSFTLGFYDGQIIKFSAKSGVGEKIVKITYISTFKKNGELKSYTDEENISATNDLNIDKNISTTVNNIGLQETPANQLSDPKIKIILTTDKGNTTEKEIDAPFKVQYMNIW